MPAQITVLLALTANLFDPVPLEKMTEAARAVQAAAEKIPAEVSARLDTAAKLSDEDKKTIVEIARKVLAPFQPKPEPKSEVKIEPKAETKDDGKVKADANPNPEVKAEPKPEIKAEPQAEIKSKAKTTPKEKS